MSLRKFFERVMGAACCRTSMSLLSEHLAQVWAAYDVTSERGQKGPRNAGRADPTGNTRRGRKAHRRESRP